MSDKNKNQKPGGSNLPPDADPNQQPPADQQPATSAIKLKLPKYDMNYNGNLIRVTAEVLEGNDDLHAYARKNFPEIFE